MKIGILHQDLEYSELEFKNIFENEFGIETRLFDVRKDISNKLDSFKPNLVFNRVYASVANRCYGDVKNTLDILNKLENKGVFCVNSFKTSSYDYSKFNAAKCMRENGVSTPETLLVRDLSKDSRRSIDAFVEKYKFPIVLKRDTGGRGKDISKIDSLRELYPSLEKLVNSAPKELYFGNFVLQEFIKSSQDTDCRITIVDGRFFEAIARTLISYGDGDEIWLASYSLGSKYFPHEPSKEELNLALNATKSIGALFNVVDIITSEKGEVIIENNPTPQYVKSDESYGGIKSVANLILNKFRAYKK